MDRDNPKSFVRAPLYTQYVKKQEEYRVHVVNGNIIAIQRKVLRREKAESGDEINWKVRNLDNGFIYQREGINPPEEVRVCALEAVRLSELDFAASDIIYNQRERRAYCLELNSAPGIQGSTVEDYAEAFRRFLN
jgi:D-alanine-D-alanine ligase-like ATP-grasp enzyme